ncbi:MAG: sigma-70 family RNA polymerase sigma factor [Bacteroidota bacterium]
MEMDSSAWKKCKNTSDEALIEMILKKGIEARKALNCLYEKLFFQFYTQKGKFSKLSDDEILTAYNEAILNVFKSIQNQSFRGDSSISTWFYKIFYRRCVDMTRKGPSNEVNTVIGIDHPSTPQESSSDSSDDFGSTEVSLAYDVKDPDANPEEVIIKQEESDEAKTNRTRLAQLIEQALQKLSERCRILIRYHTEQYSMEEIADLAELKNAHTARQTVYRCRQQMRKVLKDLMGNN